MENCILTSDCMWCNVKYIKEHIGVSHGCDAEKSAKSDAPVVQEVVGPIDIFSRR